VVNTAAARRSGTLRPLPRSGEPVSRRRVTLRVRSRQPDVVGAAAAESPIPSLESLPPIRDRAQIARVNQRSKRVEMVTFHKAPWAFALALTVRNDDQTVGRPIAATLSVRVRTTLAK